VGKTVLGMMKVVTLAPKSSKKKLSAYMNRYAPACTRHGNDDERGAESEEAGGYGEEGAEREKVREGVGGSRTKSEGNEEHGSEQHTKKMREQY
jgi:hypothetical protein